MQIQTISICSAKSAIVHISVLQTMSPTAARQSRSRPICVMHRMDMEHYVSYDHPKTPPTDRFVSMGEHDSH